MLAKKWLWTIKILPCTKKQEAERLTSQTEGGLVGFKMGDNSHFCAKFFRLDFKHSNLQILCFYDVSETKPNFFSMMKT